MHPDEYAVYFRFYDPLHFQCKGDEHVPRNRKIAKTCGGLITGYFMIRISHEQLQEFIAAGDKNLAVRI